MKKIFACVLALCPMVASADYLDDKIADLTKQKLDKIAKLEECQKSTKGLKIAGITTLGVSAIGIGANIGEAVKLNKLETQINTAETTNSNLDKQISAAEEEKAKKEKAAEEEQELQRQAANNTCGNTTSCTGAPNAESLNATDVVCINGVNKAKECKENFTGTQKSCKSNGVTVTYYENCSANASTDETCPEITQEWLTQNHVKSVECDKTTRQNYIKECADTHTGEIDENGRITKCKIKEQAQPAESDRAHHSACRDAEKIDLQSKGAHDVWVYKNKCVPKSCKTGWYLVVKGDSSQGYCVKSCPDYQKKTWTNGGQACDKLKSETLDSQTNQSGNSALQTVPVVQQNDSKIVVVQEVVQPIENKLPGRDMAGEVIYYTESVKGVVGNPVATVDGVQYKASSSTPLYSQREKSGLDNLREKLEAQGYSNFKLVRAN